MYVWKCMFQCFLIEFSQYSVIRWVKLMFIWQRYTGIIKYVTVCKCLINVMYWVKLITACAFNDYSQNKFCMSIQIQPITFSHSLRGNTLTCIIFLFYQPERSQTPADLSIPDTGRDFSRFKPWQQTDAVKSRVTPALSARRPQTAEKQQLSQPFILWRTSEITRERERERDAGSEVTFARAWSFFKRKISSWDLVLL